MIKWLVCPICFNTNTFESCPHDSKEIEDFMGKSHMISCGEFCDTCLINVRMTYE